jgi:hypothetical protein
LSCAPGDALPGAGRADNHRPVGEAGQRELVRGGQQQAVRIGEGNRLRLVEPVPLGAGVVADVAARGLAGQPLPDVPLGRAGVCRELRRGERPGLGQRPVEPELVADQHVAGRHCRAEVLHEAAEQDGELVFHDIPPDGLG